jgi:hypothetical protein
MLNLMEFLKLKRPGNLRRTAVRGVDAGLSHCATLFHPPGESYDEVQTMFCGCIRQRTG